jgi:hypothetical protein
MTIQNINIGSAANDGTGDNYRVCWEKVNDNFSELYVSASPRTDIVVAASDSTTAAKGIADYVCDGTSDEVQIQAALDAADGRRVLLAPGTFVMNANITVSSNATLEGTPGQTYIQPQDDTIPAELTSAVKQIYAAGTNASRLSNVTIRNLIFVKGDESFENVAGQIFISHADDVLVQNIKRYGNTNENVAGLESAVSLRRCQRFVVDGVHVIGGNENAAAVFFLQNWDGIVNNVRAEDMGEVIDLSSCNRLFITNTSGKGIAQEILDFGNCSDCIIDGVIGEDCYTFLQLKTERVGSPPPEYVNPFGSNRNIFTNISGTFTGVGLNFGGGATTDWPGEEQTMNNNRFANIDLRGIGGAEVAGMRIVGNDDGTPNQGTQITNFRLTTTHGYGIWYQSDHEHNIISDGYIESEDICIYDPRNSTAPMLDSWLIDNVECVLTTTTPAYAIQSLHRVNGKITNCKLSGGGIHIKDWTFFSLANITIENANQRGLFFEFRGSNTDYWPIENHYVGSSVDNVRIRNCNKQSQNFGAYFWLSSTTGVSEINGFTCNDVAIIDDQDTATSQGFFWTGTFTDFAFTNCFVPASGTDLALADPRAAFPTGATNRSFGNRGYLRSENEGTASIANTATQANLVTGITGVAAEDIVITPTNATAAALDWFVTYSSGTTCILNVVAAPGSGNTATFAWKAARVN